MSLVSQESSLEQQIPARISDIMTLSSIQERPSICSPDLEGPCISVIPGHTVYTFTLVVIMNSYTFDSPIWMTKHRVRVPRFHELWECRRQRDHCGQGGPSCREVYIKWPVSQTLRDEQEFCYMEVPGILRQEKVGEHGQRGTTRNTCVRGLGNSSSCRRRSRRKKLSLLEWHKELVNGYLFMNI